jgi:hypothetical protein
MLTIAAIFIALGLIYLIFASAYHRWLNKRQLVLAHWKGLRITRTELIEGYKRSATRHPLRGLGARVEGGNDRISVVVEGPDTLIVESSVINNLPWMRKALAQEFAAALNLASQQA